MTKEGRMYYRVRNLCGLLGLLLPWLALFSAGIAEHPGADWWWSISATYYQGPALVGVLVPASLILISYIGYDWRDALVNILTGVFGLLIVLFPCKVSWIPDGTPVGFFQLPVEISHIIHTGAAGLFFVMSAINSLFLFTLHGETMTDRKRKRNVIYRICGIGMLASEFVFLIVMLCGAPQYLFMIIEIILLGFFGFSWLVKGNAFPSLNDLPEDETTRKIR